MRKAGPAIQFYRGYRVYTGKHEGSLFQRKCVYNFKSVNFHMPRSFTWLNDSEVELFAYIDALVDKRTLDAAKYEKAELVKDAIYSDAPESKRPQVSLSPEMIVAVILGEMPIDCPIDALINFRSTSEGRYTPTRIVAELVSTGIVPAYYEGLLDFIENGRPILLQERLEGVSPEHKHERGMLGTPATNLVEAEKQGKGTVIPLGKNWKAPPYTEETVSTQEVGKGEVEVITLATAVGQPSYFVKRLYRDDKLKSAKTSWHVDGPWS